MPDEAEAKIAEQGGAIRYRTLKLPSGRFLRLAVTRDEGPQGGRTVATTETPQEPKGEGSDAG